MQLIPDGLTLLCQKGYDVISCYWEELKVRAFRKEISETVAMKSKLSTNEWRVTLQVYTGPSFSWESTPLGQSLFDKKNVP